MSRKNRKKKRNHTPEFTVLREKLLQANREKAHQGFGDWRLQFLLERGVPTNLAKLPLPITATPIEIVSVSFL